MYKIKEKPEDFIVEEIIDLNYEENGNYSYFLLEKKDLDSEDAVQNICKNLNVQRKNIAYCGNKDKIAITKQYISIQNLSKNKRIDHFFNKFSIKYLGQGNDRLNLGTNKGNKFTIIVKNANKPKQKKEILNLFGPQRFSNNNHLIGKEIIKGNFKEAVNLMLQNDGQHENEIKNYLKKQKNNFVGALRIIPKKIIKLYVHAYQSYLFNLMAKQSDKEYLPLIGFGTDENEIKEILDKENISTRDFIIKSFPEISSEGDLRKRIIQIEDLEIKKIDEKKYEISFTLPKGSYATVVIDELFC